MTSGKHLKKTLGLENFKHVSICRVLISTYKVYYVFYDSRRPQIPITNQRALRGYMPSSLQGYPFRNRPTTTPLRDIEDFNGNTSISMFFVIDMAGNYAEPKKLTHFIDSNRSQYLGKLNEFVTLADLMGNQGMSNFTQTFRKQRNKELGTENKLAKLVDLDINKPKGYITFKWLTPATEPVYPKNYKFRSVNPKNLNTEPNRSKTYELWIRILDFFEWLSVFEGEEITEKEVKEIFGVSNVQIWSDDPSYQFQTPNWNCSQIDASIFPTDIAPKHWNQPQYHGDGNAFTSKHIGGLINNIKFWYNPMASMLNKRLKDFNLL